MNEPSLENIFTGFCLDFDEDPMLEGVPLAERFTGGLPAVCPCNTTGVDPREEG